MVAELMISIAALAVSVVSLAATWRTSAVANRVATRQLEMSDRQTKIEEAQLQFQMAMELKDAIRTLIRELRQRNQTRLALKVGRCAMEWTEKHGGSLEYIPTLKERIFESTGIDIEHFVDTGRIRKRSSKNQRELHQQ